MTPRLLELNEIAICKPIACASITSTDVDIVDAAIMSVTQQRFDGNAKLFSGNLR